MKVVGDPDPDAAPEPMSDDIDTGDALGLYVSGAQTAIKNGFELPITGLIFVSLAIFSSFFFKFSPPLRRPRLLVASPRQPSLILLLRFLFRVRFCWSVGLSSLVTVIFNKNTHTHAIRSIYLHIVNNIVYTLYYHLTDQKHRQSTKN